MKDSIFPKQVNFSTAPSSNTPTPSSTKLSRDFYKGTSVRWAGEWEPGKLYDSDTYFIDYVSYAGSSWVCIKSHYSDLSTAPSENSIYWQLAAGKGAQGDIGLPAVHIGDTPPTKEEYGEDFEKVLWVDTGSTIEDTNRIYSAEEIDKKLSDLERQFYSKEETDSKYATKTDLQNQVVDEITKFKQEISEQVKAITESIPTHVSQLINDAGYITAEALKEYYTKEEINEILEFEPGSDNPEQNPEENHWDGGDLGVWI